MNKREQQRIETVAEILRMSHELFTRQGYGKTSIQQIADACGLSKGAMYHHFDSKEAVLEEICLREYRGMSEKFEPVRDSTDIAGLEKLKVIMAATRANPMNMSSYTYSAGGRDVDNAVMEKIMASYGRRLYLEIFGPILEEARELGQCRFVGTGEFMALYIHCVDNSISEEVGRIMREASPEDRNPKLESVLDGFVHVLGSILGITPDQVADLIQLESLKRALDSPDQESDKLP